MSKSTLEMEHAILGKPDLDSLKNRKHATRYGPQDRNTSRRLLQHRQHDVERVAGISGNFPQPPAFLDQVLVVGIKVAGAGWRWFARRVSRGHDDKRRPRFPTQPNLRSGTVGERGEKEGHV